MCTFKRKVFGVGTFRFCSFLLSESYCDKNCFYFHLPSEMVDGWKFRAEKAGVSISKFVVDRVEGSIRKKEG